MSPLTFHVRVKRSDPWPTQTPLTQACDGPQTRPHAPHEAASLVRLRQVPEQLESPAGHTQLPTPSHDPPVGEEHAPEVRGTAEQVVVVPEQTTVPPWAQPPVPAEVQLAPVARHVPPQLVCPAGHDRTQAPAEQLTPPPIGAVHATPQPPQLLRSLASARQVPPQLVCPAGQAHTPPAPQAPPAGEEHAPEVRGTAEQVVVVREQTTVPLWAQPPVPAEVQPAPVARQVPAQLVWPAGHACTQALPVQVALPPTGAAHTTPQRPQLPVLERVSTSQPLAALPSQLAKPALHAPMPQTPAEHTDEALALEQALPQRPQLPVLERVSTSQPFAALPSQSAKPALQVNPHAPAEQNNEAFARAGQTRPQPPQFWRLVLVFTSQPLLMAPSQSPVPATQAPMAHTPATQMRDPAVGVGHTLPQVAQLLTSLCVTISQPSP
jgi:hypothetical protein